MPPEAAGTGPGAEAPAGEPAAGGRAPRVVIDTNIWLDLYIFADAAALELAAALAAGTLRAVRSDATDAELRRVLARPAFAERAAALGAEPLQAWQGLAERATVERRAPWLCTDADDQKFLDLAFSVSAVALFTKDRALLRLARRARAAGLAIRLP